MGAFVLRGRGPITDTEPNKNGKRPVGRPPFGKVWDDEKSKYVEKSESDSEANLASEKKRPPGRPPADKDWDSNEGMYCPAPAMVVAILKQHTEKLKFR